VLVGVPRQRSARVDQHGTEPEPRERANRGPLAPVVAARCCVATSGAFRCRAGYDLVFWHPPYHDMKIYTDDPRDLSRAGSLAAFGALLREGYWRFFDLLAPGGRLAILIGDMRRRGRYEPLTADVARLDRAHLESIVVKIQHNVSSNQTRYGGQFVPILHETLTIFRKPAV
jgi:hypothetical protein